ncbi:MAG: hypothetical protein FJ125_05775 [Deltaproteobacteria bacterium]|nr:hypothetical protein [Deltaproteobacteria bacterium]
MGDRSFVVEGKLALPYQYFAGRTGSKFLVTLRDGKKILAIKGKKVYVPPRSVEEQRITDRCTEWVKLPGTGTVTGYTVIRYAEPYQPKKPPYILALIRLDGADTPLTHIVQGISPEEMKVGLAVEAVFADQPTSTILAIDHFAPRTPVAPVAPVAPPPAAPSGRLPEPATKGAAGGPAGGGKLPYRLGYSYDELEVGMSASFAKTITETDVYLFAGISGDFNPVHVDEEFAKLTPFGKRIAHGALPQSLIAPVLGMKLPGLGTVALEVTARFRAPTFFGDTITATATVAEKLPEKRRVRLDCRWTNQRGEVVATGSALVIPPPRS